MRIYFFLFFLFGTFTLFGQPSGSSIEKFAYKRVRKMGRNGVLTSKTDKLLLIPYANFNGSKDEFRQIPQSDFFSRVEYQQFKYKGNHLIDADFYFIRPDSSLSYWGRVSGGTYYNPAYNLPIQQSHNELVKAFLKDDYVMIIQVLINDSFLNVYFCKKRNNTIDVIMEDWPTIKLLDYKDFMRNVFL